MGEDLRGGCGDMSLELYGEFTGYNTGPTMQIGLWLSNDAAHIKSARLAAAGGPEPLRNYVLAAIMVARPGDPPMLAWEAVLETPGGEDLIDWAQICFSLLYVDPDEQDLENAREYLRELMGSDYEPEESELWRVADNLIIKFVSDVALRGMRA